MRVLITGARGQLGQSLRERAPEDWEVIFTDSKTLDITNQSKVHSMVLGFQPDVIINTAAYTNVNQAEKEPDIAFAINANGPRYLAEAAQQLKAKLIHISTDFVFDGNKESPYINFDVPNPINSYGKSKLAGETLALAICEDTHIIRTSSLFSEFGHNFLHKILAKAEQYENIDIVDTETYPTDSNDLAQFIIEICTEENIPKIVHFCGLEKISWADFASMILQAASYSNIAVNKIAAISLTENIVNRPKNSLLANTIARIDSESLSSKVLSAIKKCQQTN